MVKEVSLALRNRAIGMIKCGLTQIVVAKDIGGSVRTVRGRWLCFQNRVAVANRRGRGRKSVIGKIPKIVIAKSLGKRQKSTRKLSKIL